MEALKKKILDKREFKGLDIDFLDVFIEEYIKKNPSKFNLLKEKGFNEKSKEFLLFKKHVRKRLREVHGVFSKKPLSENKKNDFLKKINFFSEEKNYSSLKNVCLDMLKNHRSTYERISDNNNYVELYKKIFDLTNAKRILDLGCGVNAFSVSFMSEIDFYTGIEINKDEIFFVNEFFKNSLYSGECLYFDLTSEEGLDFVKNVSHNYDVCFMFKLLDGLEAKKRGSSKLLFNVIKSKFVVVSFACKSIGGKQEIKGERSWFKRIVQDKKFSCFKLGDEEYFVINM